MSARYFKVLAIPTLGFSILCACASNFAVYEPPTSGRMSKITFVNLANTQKVTVATFDDGITCTRKRHIQFENEDGIPAGGSRSLIVTAGKEFALFASLDAIKSDEYGIDIGITGGGPAPVISRSVTAIGCNAKFSFGVEPDKDYQIVMSEPVTAGFCSIVVSAVNENGERAEVETAQRILRSPQDELGSFCEPLEN